MKRKNYLSLAIIMCALTLFSCTKDDPDSDEENVNGQIPTTGILYKGDLSIYVMNVDGSNPRKLSLSTRNYGEDFPTSSPDGKKIVFRRFTEGLVVMDANGEKVILNDLNAPSYPTWADNSKIYYTRYNGATSNAKEFVYSINADGTGDTQVSPAYTDIADPQDFYPSVSPDNAYLLFDTNRPSNGGTILKMKLSDGSSSYLTYSGSVLGESVISPAEQATWSPNGTKIAFAAYPGYPDFKPEQIYVMNADGSGKTQLTNETEAGCSYPSWSPDGTKIVFQKEYPGFANSLEIWIMNADGSGAKALTDRTETGWEMHPSFIGKPR